MGYSRRLRPPALRTIAKLPSGPQSAAITPSSTSRAEPLPGGTRASVPAKVPAHGEQKIFRFIETAISPEREMASRSVSFAPSGRASEVFPTVENSSVALPCHLHRQNARTRNDRDRLQIKGHVSRRLEPLFWILL